MPDSHGQQMIACDPSASSVPQRFKGFLAVRLSACTVDPSGLKQTDINKWVTIKSFAIIYSFGVQPVAPVEFE
jgi:hypothetical protein